MSYRIPPFPIIQDPNIKVAPSVVSPELCDKIREIGDRLIEQRDLPARVGFHEQARVDEELRHAHTQWLPEPSETPWTQWIYDMGAEVIQQANALFWQYDISDFYDQLHYVRYDGSEQGHFDWHQDRGDDWRRPQRKLAFSLLLSDPAEYDGGEFQIFDGKPLTIKAKEKGTAIVFPSFIQHRVTPVTRGERRSLIGWASGPKFR